MFPEPPEPTLAEVWAALNRRLSLAPWRGPTDIAEGPLLHKLAAHGVGCLADSNDPLKGAYYNAFTFGTDGHVKTICGITVGEGTCDWVEASAADPKEAFCRAALKALEWVDRQRPQESAV